MLREKRAGLRDKSEFDERRCNKSGRNIDNQQVLRAKSTECQVEAPKHIYPAHNQRATPSTSDVIILLFLLKLLNRSLHLPFGRYAFVRRVYRVVPPAPRVHCK